MKTKNFTLIFFAVMLVSVSGSYSQNLLTDGDFSTTTIITPHTEGVGPANLWCSFQNAGTEAIATVDAGVCNYQVVNGGYSTWEVQLEQWGFSLTPGNYYRLSFDFRADAERWFGVYLGEDGGSWTSILGYDNYYQYATTDWQTIILDFNAATVFPYHKFSLEIGAFNTSMYFDNIMLVDLGPNPSVGIIGTAVNGWDNDVDMVTTDGITYT
ncbi:MAG: carbohydrate binding domain-containing protein, partial [Bacteroidales bacterium]|nr:carbohydrate binding domain-containing protein [Bacteroidales bacterium]